VIDWLIRKIVNVDEINAEIERQANLWTGQGEG